jgi:hypothetical protein
MESCLRWKRNAEKSYVPFRFDSLVNQASNVVPVPQMTAKKLMAETVVTGIFSWSHFTNAAAIWLFLHQRVDPLSLFR